MKIRQFLIIVILLYGYHVTAQQGEIIYTGNVAKAGYDNNVSYGPFNIGFNFTYFGNTYTQFYVSSNGLVTFGSGSTDASEDPIPTSGTPNDVIAAFWDDLVIDPSGSILYTTVGGSPNRKLIVQFRNMGFYFGPTYFGTFSVILYETSNIIQIQYRVLVLPSSTLVHGGNATIGIENSDGSAGVQYAYHDPAAINTGQAISFVPSGLTYTTDPDAMYDGVYLTTNLTLPEPGIPQLLSPSEDAVIGSSHTFEWAASTDAGTYTLKIATNSNLSGATNYNAGSNLSYTVSGLTLNTTYYWGVFATNATGTTWCEIRRFTTSAAPPLAAVPQTAWVEQNQQKTIKLNYTGGDASTKTATVTTQPPQGTLYQYNAGALGDEITTFPATVTDANLNVIYFANEGYGNSAGNFNFYIHDNTGNSPEATVTVNVSPPGMPNLLYTGKSTTYVEMQFDRIMADPAGKQSQFTATVNGLAATFSSLALKTGDPYTIVATFTTPVVISDAITIAYNAGDVASAQGGLLATFSAQTVSLLAQTITFTVNLSRKYGDAPFALGATASSGQPMTYSSSNLSVATITGSTLTILYAGNSDITARQAGNGTYAPARYVRTLFVAKGDQTITFSALSDKTYGDGDYSISASASSGLSVSFSSTDLSVATVTGTTVHIAGAGTTTITASQAGNSLWNPAPDVPQSLHVNKANQTITFGSLSGKTYGDPDYSISATASSGLTVSFVSGDPAVATVAGNTVHISGGGITVITASQGGNTNYNAAPNVPQTLTVSKADLTVTADNKTKEYLAVLPVFTITYSGFVNADNQSVLDVPATASTTATESSPVGEYAITASGGSDNSYNYIYEEGVLTVTKIQQTITITDSPEKLLVTDTYTLVATATSGLPVEFESGDNSIAVISGNQVTGVEKGIVQVRAFNDGDANYDAAEAFATIEVYSTHRDVMHLFTPNGDAFNNLWELPELATWGKCEVRVFSRSGKLVFADDNYNNTWDGMSDGKPVPEGAYYFVIKTENAGVVKGTVNIVR